MKLGKLIISSNLPVLKEVLINNYNSILIKDFKNEKNWLNKIQLINNSLDRHNSIKKNAFTYAKKFDLDWRVKKLLSL